VANGALVLRSIVVYLSAWYFPPGAETSPSAPGFPGWRVVSLSSL